MRVFELVEEAVVDNWNSIYIEVDKFWRVLQHVLDAFVADFFAFTEFNMLKVRHRFYNQRQSVVTDTRARNF